MTRNDNNNDKGTAMNATISQKVTVNGKSYLASGTHLLQVFVDGHRKTCGITGRNVSCCGYWKTLRKPIAR
jgi:hypothetical protein